MDHLHHSRCTVWGHRAHLRRCVAGSPSGSRTFHPHARRPCPGDARAPPSTLCVRESDDSGSSHEGVPVRVLSSLCLSLDASCLPHPHPVRRQVLATSARTRARPHPGSGPHPSWCSLLPPSERCCRSVISSGRVPLRFRPGGPAPLCCLPH